MKRSVRHHVRERALRKCEYCHIPDHALWPNLFHVEHIIARQHDGSDSLGNLCWCCQRCNAKKGPNLSGRDPLTGAIVTLFNPRMQHWPLHFQWVDVALLGHTRIGRATIAVLGMNEDNRVDLRIRLRDRENWNDTEASGVQ